jgi:hypothetical protein
VGGAAAGAAAGTVAGPVGTVAGAVAGAIVGGLAGKGVAELIDPTREDAYWRENYKGRPYVRDGSTYDDYGPAYGYGVNSYSRYPGRRFDEVEPDLAENWETSRGKIAPGMGRREERDTRCMGPRERHRGARHTGRFRSRRQVA